MCKICDKADTIIDMVEDFFTVEDLKKLLFDVIDKPTEDVKVVLGVKSIDDITAMDVHMNIISAVCVRWFLRHNFSPQLAMMCFSEQMGHQYSKDMAIKMFEMVHGRKPTEIELKERMRDLES